MAKEVEELLEELDERQHTIDKLKKENHTMKKELSTKTNALKLIEETIE